MRIIDSPIPQLAGKTPRELVLLAVVSAATYLCYGHWPEFVTALGVTLLFALRVPQARPIAVGFCLGWLVSITAMMRADGVWDLENPRLLVPAFLLLLLSSRDLFERFDAAPARLVPNVWRDLPSKHWRMMRWCAYGLGVLASLVVPGWLWASSWWHVSTTQPTWVLVGIIAALALLVIGSALGFVLAASVAGYTLFKFAPELLSDAAFTPGLRPGMLVPLCAAALFVLVLAAPYCVRLVRPRKD